MLTNAIFDLYSADNQIYPTYMDGADLRGAHLGGAYLAGVSLAGADFSGADLSAGGSSPVILAGTSTIGGEIRKVRAKLSGANFNNAFFPSANLQGMDLQGIDFNHANLRTADLRQADLSKANLTFADLRGANLSAATVDGTDLSNANLAGADLSYTMLNKATLRDATLFTRVPVTFTADLTFEDFFNFLIQQDCTNGTFLVNKDGTINEVPVRQANDLGRAFYDSGAWRGAAMYICGADLSYMSLKGRKTRQVSVAGLDLHGADLSSTDLSNMIFEETIMVGDTPYKLAADLSGVIYDNFTIWPPGFTPPQK